MDATACKRRPGVRARCARATTTSPSIFQRSTPNFVCTSTCILGIKKSSWFFKLSSLCKKILSPHRVTVTCNCTRSRSLSTATPWFCKFFTSNKKQHARAITMHSIGACASSSTLLCVTVCTHATHSSPFCSLFCTIVHSTN